MQPATPIPRASIDARTAVEFALVTAIWGSTWLVIKGQLGIVPPLWSVTYRFAAAGSVLALAAAATGRWRWPTRTGHAFAAVVGLVQFTLNYNLVYAAETRLASGPVALVFALLIVPNAVLAAVFLDVPITWRFAVGSVVGVLGLVLLFAHDLAAPGGSAGIGLLLAASAVLFASIGNVLQAGRVARSLPPVPTLALAMGYGALIDAGVAAVTTGPPVADPRPEYWAGLAYLAIAASVVAFSVYFRLIRRIGPGPAAYTSVVVPIIAMALSTLFEGYRWTVASAAGTGLVVVGLAVALGSGRFGVSRGTRAIPLESRAMPD